MTTFTVFATATTSRPLADVEAAVRAALEGVGAELVECNWAPDPDTISDAVPDGPVIELVDLN
jgi:hypothetical protein